MLIDARLDPGLQNSHRALGFSELLSKLDLELCDLVRCRGDSGNDVTRQQPHSELVRIVENDRVLDGQIKRRGGRYGRSQRQPILRWLHPADPLTAADLRRPPQTEARYALSQVPRARRAYWHRRRRRSSSAYALQVREPGQGERRVP